MPYSVGDTVVLDGIESVIIYDAGSDQSWGRYIVVDKNHDLVYYTDGNDYVDDDTPSNQWGFEWGGYLVDVGTDDSAIGGGLNNSNIAISKNLKPHSGNWPVLWNKLEEFRSNYSDKWFLPSIAELRQVYNNRALLTNLSFNSYTAYWSSYSPGTTSVNIFYFGGTLQPGTQSLLSRDSTTVRSRLCRYTTDEELDSPKIGDTYTLDGVESVIIYDAGSEQDWGRFILADKNHDLSYYIIGDDYVDSSDYNTAPGTFGYEWGSYGAATGITSQEIGDGLSNTNSLIGLNLQPQTSGWRVLWDMVEQFRFTHSDDWFVPAVQELQQVYNLRSYLNNLSTSTNPYYWSSSEYDSSYACFVIFSNGNSYSTNKYTHYRRARLCRYASYALLTGKTIGMSCSTPSSTIYYTTDNSTPSNASNLYSNNFLIETGTTIKAIGTREGWLDSDIATLTVEE